MSEPTMTLNQFAYEQFLIDATAAYLDQNKIEPDAETLRCVSVSMAEVGSGWARRYAGTKRVDFYKHLLLTAQLAGEEG